MKLKINPPTAATPSVIYNIAFTDELLIYDEWLKPRHRDGVGSPLLTSKLLRAMLS